MLSVGKTPISLPLEPLQITRQPLRVKLVPGLRTRLTTLVPPPYLPHSMKLDQSNFPALTKQLVPRPLVTCQSIPGELSLPNVSNMLTRQYMWVINQAWGQDGWILIKIFYFASLQTPRKDRSTLG